MTTDFLRTPAGKAAWIENFIQGMKMQHPAPQLLPTAIDVTRFIATNGRVQAQFAAKNGLLLVMQKDIGEWLTNQ